VQALTLTAVRKDDKADLSLRLVYNYGNYGVTAIFNTSDKVNVTATIDKVCTAVCTSMRVGGGVDIKPSVCGREQTRVKHSLRREGHLKFGS
jgi:hypothetical protein